MDRKFDMDSTNLYRDRIYRNYISSINPISITEALANFKSRAPYLIRLIKNGFPANLSSDILDLGCGSGALIYLANQLGYMNIIGVDVSSQQVEVAKNIGILNISEGDLFQKLLESPAESFDCVVTFDVLEHFNKNEIIKFVDEIHRVLRKQGIWIIHVPNGDSIFCGRILHGDFTHETAFTPSSILQLLNASGFNKVDIIEDSPVVHGFKSLMRNLLWRLIRRVLYLCLLIETGGIEREAVFSQNFLAIASKSKIRGA